MISLDKLLDLTTGVYFDFYDVYIAGESYYSSPPNVFLPKSPVLKPAPGRISCKTVPIAPPDAVLRKQENVVINSFSLWQPSSCRAAMKRWLTKIAGFGEGAIGRVRRYRFTIFFFLRFLILGA